MIFKKDKTDTRTDNYLFKTVYWKTDSSNSWTNNKQGISLGKQLEFKKWKKLRKKGTSFEFMKIDYFVKKYKQYQ